MKRRKTGLFEITRNCIIFLFFAVVFFFGSYAGMRDLQEWQTWKPSRATFIEVNSEKYYDKLESDKTKRRKTREWGTIEFTKADGSVCQGTFEWVHTTHSPTLKSVGDRTDVIYDLDSDEWIFGDVPDDGDYIIMYVFRYVCLALIFIIVIYWIKSFIKIRSMEYDRGNSLYH